MISAHILLSLFFTWPLALNLVPGASPATPGIIVVDRDQNLWNLWWVRHALLNGQNPFVTDMIWYPTPVSLYYHTLNIFNGLLAVPLLSVFSLVTTYNLIVLFSFVAAGYGAFLLVRYLTGKNWAAMVGSVVFAYSAYHIATMRGLLQLISLEWVPFYVLFLLMTLEGVGGSSIRLRRQILRNGALAGFFLFLVVLVDWYYTLYMLMMTGLLGLWGLVRVLRSGRVRRGLVDLGFRLLVLGVVFLALTAPILVPTLRELRGTSYMVPNPEEAVRYSADLLAFFQPPQGHRLWGEAFRSRQEWPFGNNRYEVYLTYTALVLAGVALFAGRKHGKVAASQEHRAFKGSLPGEWFWASCALLFFLLALGPVLQVNGVQVRWLFDPALKIPMPYQVLERLPVFNIGRSPDRFAMPLTLCLAVLAGHGFNVLRATWTRLRTSVTRTAALGAGLICLLALEQFPAPYPQRPAEMPSWYAQVGREQGDFTILELPPQDEYWHGAYRMYFQTAHEKPIFGGYISREYPHPFLTSTPGFQDLQYADGEGDMFRSSPATWNSALSLHHVRYIVLQKRRLPDRPEEPPDVSPWREAINRGGGGEYRLVYADDFLEAYEVPKQDFTSPFLSVGDGWGQRELGPNGAFRWMGERATIRVHSPTRQDAYLRLGVSGLGPERTLRILHGDHLVFEGNIGGLRELSIGPLGLPPGTSTLTFESPEGTVRPSEVDESSDMRNLSFAVLDARLEEADR